MSERKNIFFRLVFAQDERLMTVHQTRAKMMTDFGIDDVQLRAIEDEGIDAGWLDEYDRAS